MWGNLCYCDVTIIRAHLAVRLAAGDIATAEFINIDEQQDWQTTGIDAPFYKIDLISIEFDNSRHFIITVNFEESISDTSLDPIVPFPPLCKCAYGCTCMCNTWMYTWRKSQFFAKARERETGKDGKKRKRKKIQNVRRGRWKRHTYSPGGPCVKCVMGLRCGTLHPSTGGWFSTHAHNTRCPTQRSISTRIFRVTCSTKGWY